MKNIRNVIGPQLRKIRNERQMTQDLLAARLQRAGWDISRSSLAKIEAQLRWVADCELYLLSSVLETPMLAFFPAPSEIKKFVGSPEFKRN